MSSSLLRSRTAVTVMASFMSAVRVGTERGKNGRKTMIRKRWRDGEAVLSVETEDEFWKAATTGEPVELTHELADKIGLMEEDVGTLEDIKAARYDPSD